MGSDIEDAMKHFKKKLFIRDVIDSMKKVEQVDCPVKHHFAVGQYVRETFFPKGTFVIGKKHRFSTVNIVMKGKISLFNMETKEVIDIEAPCIFTSQAGVQKIGYAHTDTIWVNSHPTTETDLEKIESIFILKNEKEQICHG